MHCPFAAGDAYREGGREADEQAIRGVMDGFMMHGTITMPKAFAAQFPRMRTSPMCAEWGQADGQH